MSAIPVMSADNTIDIPGMFPLKVSHSSNSVASRRETPVTTAVVGVMLISRIDVKRGRPSTKSR